MVSLAFAGFGLAETAQNQPEADPGSAFWQHAGLRSRFDYG
jgi:hypothetical protein